ncbi:MAG: class I SAM-dependent methyltransferase [Cyanobacteria bacterium P01_F01_bin.56]
MTQASVATATLSGVPRTSLLTTRGRVDEHYRPDGLLRDPLVADGWAALSWDTSLDSLYTPLSRLGWAVRAHLIDEIVQRHLAVHQQAVVVELGSGRSTRSYRVGQLSHYWLELGLPETIALRRQFDTENDRHRFLPVSALAFNWLDEIPDCSPENLLIVAEGLLMYFEPDEVQTLITRLKQRFLGATIVFDVVGSVTKGQSAQRLAASDAPLKWFIQNEHDLPRMGLTVLEARSLVREMCRYRRRTGGYRWVPWLSYLPPLRNASLLIEARLQSTRSGS